jgi:hypothetical protein
MGNLCAGAAFGGMLLEGNPMVELVEWRDTSAIPPRDARARAREKLT